MPAGSSLMSGVPELLVLQLLRQREMYGYELARAIRTVSADEIAVAEGVLYPALHVLEGRRLVKSRKLRVDGRTRVYYSISAKGRRRLAELTAQWRRISNGVEAVLAGVPHA